VHSFDPGGTDVLLDHGELPEGFAIERFEDDLPNHPEAYTKWEARFNELGRAGMFKYIGTYCLDSTTTFSTSMIWQILKKEGRIQRSAMTSQTDDKQYGMRIQDWGCLLTNFIAVVRSINSLPCHTILMGHIDRDRDEVTQGFVKTILLPGQSKAQIPILMPEVYYLIGKATPTGFTRMLLTQYDGEFRGTTRMGKNCFQREETPDIRALLKKAGFDWEDIN